MPAWSLYLPAGSRVRYALLGGELVPGPGESLTIEVPFSGEHGDVVPWRLASKLDEVRDGFDK